MPKEDRYHFTPAGKLPPQTTMVSSRAVIKRNYMLLPADVIPRSNLPFWENTIAWPLAIPAISFGTAFAQYMIYVDTGGGCDEPEFEEGVQSIVFVLDGTMSVKIQGDAHDLTKGGYAYIPPDTEWSLHNTSDDLLKIIWLRKLYEPLPGLSPAMIVGYEQELPDSHYEGTAEVASKTLIPTDDMAYDFHMNLSSFEPGSTLAMSETHVMEHGLYMLQGQGVYLLNEDWHEVKGGDFIWMRAYCPQSYYAGGPVPTRYLLYKNMNRQFKLRAT
jgi:(S)-ureidoglycine aminohydrolase